MDLPDKANPAVYAVVLAAGASRRFAGTKLLETFRGESLIARAARLARASCGERSVLVTGHRGDEIAAAAGGACAIVIANPRYRDGMGSSIAVAARTLADRADAMLLLLADQPLVDVAHLERMLATWRHQDEIVATAYSGTQGPPVLLPAASFAALSRLEGDRGARALFDDDRFRVRLITFEPAGVDVDTPGDLAALRVAE